VKVIEQMAPQGAGVDLIVLAPFPLLLSAIGRADKGFSGKHGEVSGASLRMKYSGTFSSTTTMYFF
jgi:hypothetical protein